MIFFGRLLPHPEASPVRSLFSWAASKYLCQSARTLKAVQIKYVQRRWRAEKEHRGDKRRYTSTGILKWKRSHYQIGHSIKYTLGYVSILQRHKKLVVRYKFNSRWGHPDKFPFLKIL